MKKTIRNILPTISIAEAKIFIPMALMMMCILFNFGTLRSVKDSLVVPNIGAEVISFLKMWLVLPSTIIFTMIYMKISNMFKYEHLFYIIVSCFLLFFLLFAYVLLPNQDFYHPSTETIARLIDSYPHFKWFFFILGKWSYAMMYVFCELWSVVVINLLFWQHTNHIFDTESAKRLYPIFGLIGNIGLIIAGNVLVSLTTNSTALNAISPVINVVVFVGILAMILYWYIDNCILKGKKNSLQLNDTKTKLSFKESISLVLGSKYIRYLVLIVLCYGFLINILEGPWKAAVRQIYPTTNEYLQFMGNFNIYMGCSCIVFTLIGSNLLRRFPWILSALITPSMICITGLIFFIVMIFADNINLGFSPLYFAVLVGATQNILSKSAKYSLFDSTKEMAYIPLSLELKTKGKAAVEVMGLKFGKGLGAFVQSCMFLIMPCGSFDSIITYLLIMFIFVAIIWFISINQLNKLYTNLITTK